MSLIWGGGKRIHADDAPLPILGPRFEVGLEEGPDVLLSVGPFWAQPAIIYKKVTGLFFSIELMSFG